MIRFIAVTSFVLCAAHTAAQVTVPKGYAIGDIIVIDPNLCQVMEFDLPEPLPEMFKQ